MVHIYIPAARWERRRTSRGCPRLPARCNVCNRPPAIRKQNASTPTMRYQTAMHAHTTHTRTHTHTHTRTHAHAHAHAHAHTHAHAHAHAHNMCMCMCMLHVACACTCTCMHMQHAHAHVRSVHAVHCLRRRPVQPFAPCEGRTDTHTDDGMVGTHYRRYARHLHRLVLGFPPFPASRGC